MKDVCKLDIWSQYETPQPRQRLVLLGASNLTRAFPTVVSTAQEYFLGPLSICASMGHGRSYGQESRIFFKKNSGIIQSGLWRYLEEEKSLPTVAWITDIGNDLGYEVPVQTVLKWVEGCWDRLRSHGARVVVSDLPLQVIESLNPTQYGLFRALFFPKCRLELSEMIERARRLSDALQKMAAQRQTPIIIAQNQWYGWDPIHPRRSSHAAICREVLSAVVEEPAGRLRETHGILQAWYLRQLRPEVCTWCGLQRRVRQPHGRFHDGTTIALF